MTFETFWTNLPQILVALATLVTALGGLIISWRTNIKVNQVQQQTNGMNARIVMAERKDARDIERATPTAVDSPSPPDKPLIPSHLST